MSDKMTEEFFIFVDDDFNIIEWKKCEVNGCSNGVCYRLDPNNRFCWPHSMTGGCKELTTKKKEKTK